MAEFGQVCAESGLFGDARSAAKAIVKIQAGRELGVPPVVALTGVNIIGGKVTLSANLMAALVKRHDRYDYVVKALTEARCVLEFWYEEELLGESVFSMDDARRAGLAGGASYKHHPRNMLFARAMSNGAKWYCPDVFAGMAVYTPDELDAVLDGATGEVLAGPDAPTPTPEVAAIPTPSASGPALADDAQLDEPESAFWGCDERF